MGKYRDNEIKALFALVRAGLWEKEVRLLPFEGVDLARVLRLAQEQSVVGLVAAGLEHVLDAKIPQAAALSFAGVTLQFEHRNTAMNEFLAKLMQQLRDAGVFALLVKGQGIAQCYERPLWRASGDIDLLLDEVNYAKAKVVLAGIAQEVKEEDPFSKHQSFMIDSWEVECHGTLRSALWRKLDRVIDAVQADAFANKSVRVWRNGATDVYIPAADNDVIFVFGHILQHFFKTGVGLRQICDWCRLVWTFRESLDSSLLERRLRAMGALSEWRALAALAVDYLGMPADAMPLYSSAHRWSRKALRILRLVFMTGNMGHNQDLSYLRTSSYWGRKFRSFWRHICETWRFMVIFPWDSFRVLGRKIVRGITGIAHGG